MPFIEWKDGQVRFLDQRRLPLEEVYIETSDVRVLAEAMRTLQVRGAPALGIAAGFGMALGALAYRGTDAAEFLRHLSMVDELLSSTRPTAVNLFWALRRIRKTVYQSGPADIRTLRDRILREALAIMEEDVETCRVIGEHGSEIISPGVGIMTYCNAGALATGGIGTALGIIIQAHREGKSIRVYACETRPLFQGARLTMWELARAGVDATLITDNAAATVMRQGKVQVVITGADRIAANGDTANKIGTYPLAVLARQHRIPMYIAAPVSTFDPGLRDGSSSPIEERSHTEVTDIAGIRVAPRDVAVFSPAFDVTPHQFISGIITERGILRPPFGKAIQRLMPDIPERR